MAIRGCVSAIGVFVAVGCASPTYVGRWGHEDANMWAGVALNPDGSCLMVGGEKGSVGGAVMCRYSVQREIVTITEISDGKHWNPPPQKLTMKHRGDQDTFTVSWEKDLELRRVPKLYHEP